MSIVFPQDFLFGTSTSAHQIEGDNINNDWWRAEQQGKVPYKSGKACDFWNKYEEDLKLMSELGYNTFRFSIEWSRIMPKQNELRKEPLHVYSRIVDLLREYRIQPFVTLLHFTLPTWFADAGGFEKRKNLVCWKKYVATIVEELGDRVNLWGPVNEIQAYASCSYFLGIYPPFKRSFKSYKKVFGNCLLAHADAYKIIKDKNPKALVGPVLDTPLIKPFNSKSFLDKLAASFVDKYTNNLYIETFSNLKLPQELGGEKIDECANYIGINYYTRYKVKFNDVINYYSKRRKKREKLASPTTNEVTDMGWEVYPSGLFQTIKRYFKEIGKPVIVTENGIATRDDTKRIRFILRHLAETKRAMDKGCDVRGYFYWSLLDNFEWTKGFEPRFGLIEVDYRTFERRPRESALLYGKIARSKRIDEETLKKYKVKGIR